MDKTSKELLQFEHIDTSSVKDSSLLICGRSKSLVEEKQLKPPSIGSLPSCEVLGKVKDFLGVISEANKNLELKAKENPEDYNIENLNGNESEFIEMDLMLGVADLHTPEAMAAAEAAIAGNQSVINLMNEGSSESESSDENDDSGSDDDAELKQDGVAVQNQPECNKKRKHTKIVELS